MGLSRPEIYTIQWILTEHCNWKCRHCYQDFPYEDLSTNSLLKIFQQFLDLFKYLKAHSVREKRLSVSGGEPLLRKDFFLLLEEISNHRDLVDTIVILSNGSVINEDNAIRLKALGVDAFQVSLEGMRENNDFIRGKDSFKKIIQAINILVDANIKVLVSFTLTKNNIKDVPELIRLCDELGVFRLGIRRMVPIGRGESLKEKLLTPYEIKEIYNCVEKNQQQPARKLQILTSLSRGCEEGIFSQENNLETYHCGVIDDRTLTVMPDGTVYPCRRLPIPVGNLLKEDIFDIFFSEKMQQFQNLDNYSEECKSCPYFKSCFSGARCMAYAYFNDQFAPDPQCWKLFKKLPEGKLNYSSTK